MGGVSFPHLRMQVMELLTHISRRLKSRPEVQLPVEQLLLQFTDPSSPPAVVVREGGGSEGVREEREEEREKGEVTGGWTP